MVGFLPNTHLRTDGQVKSSLEVRDQLVGLDSQVFFAVHD